MAYYQPYLQPTYNQLATNLQPQTQVANGSFVPIPNEIMARNYPVAHGNSVTFKDENAPYVYVKTVGFSQMDVPVFEKYRLIKELDSCAEGAQTMQAGVSMDPNENGKIEALEGRIDAMKRDIDKLLAFKAELEGGESDVE